MDSTLRQNHSHIINLVFYSFAHAVVDATCAALIFSLLKEETILIQDEFWNLVVLYNILAFGLQFLLGILVDFWQFPRLSAGLGCFMTAIAMLCGQSFPIPAICLAGIGNALFHIGGGSITLNLTPGRTTSPGIFVAPGALGLLAGTLWGKSQHLYGWIWPLVLICLCIITAFLKTSPKHEPKDADNQENIAADCRKIANNRQDTANTRKSIERNKNSLIWIFLLVFFSIAIRSLLGLSLQFHWKADMTLLVLLVLAIAGGKALGGFVADRVGWVSTAVVALLISAPLLSFGKDCPYLAIPGMLLFQMPMPITLVAIAEIFPRKPAFAFGLTCLALILGALPAFAGMKPIFNQPWISLSIVTTAAIFLLLALTKENSKK